MVDRLQPKARSLILEPCAGDGAFIEALLELGVDFSIDAYELNIEAYSKLRKKFSQYDNIHVYLKDTILETGLPLFDKKFDRIIGNPPYGAWQNYERRAQLKKLYPSLYVKETYTLFLHRCIDLLKPNGRLVFIVPNTFLNLHRHTGIRKKVLQETELEEVAIFPSKFFPGVNFGYAEMCIVTLHKRSVDQAWVDHRVRVFTDLTTVDDLIKVRNGEWHSGGFSHYELKQTDIYKSPDHALLIHPNPQIPEIITSPRRTIGDVADCVTGFYSGNDKKYLRRFSEEVRRGQRYAVVDKNHMCSEPAKHKDILGGIDPPACFVPIVKGGAIRYVKPDDWYMDWSKRAVAEYKKSKRARFQNSQYYFKSGIGVPMVSSVPVSGALLERKLFDQSIVGVFPKDRDLLSFLLAYFNSEICGELISTINPTANNSANYIRKIPVVLPSASELEIVERLTQSILSQIRATGSYEQSYQQELDRVFWRLLGLESR